MKKLVMFIGMTLILFTMSHCEFKSSTASDKNWNKHLVKSDQYYSSFQYDEFTIDGMEYRAYFSPQLSSSYESAGGIFIINKTLDRLQKQKLELEIKKLRNESN